MSRSNDHKWWEYCQNNFNEGIKYGIFPELYASEVQYKAALEEAKERWSLLLEYAADNGISRDEYDTDEEFIEAVEEIKYEWRLSAFGGAEYGIYPEDYETEEEYQNAVMEAGIKAIDLDDRLKYAKMIADNYNISQYLANGFPDERTKEAAKQLCAIIEGTALIPVDTNIEDETEKCLLILKGENTASKYITVWDGILFSKAIKDNFNVNVCIEEEDNEQNNDFSDIYRSLAEDTDIAVEVWAWLVKEFSPYKKYMRYNQSIYNEILDSYSDYPDSFLEKAAIKLGEDKLFREELLTNNEEFPYEIYEYIVKAIELRLYNVASLILEATLANPIASSKHLKYLINDIIDGCESKDLDGRLMRAFQRKLIPIIEKVNNKQIQLLLPTLKERASEYLADYPEPKPLPITNDILDGIECIGDIYTIYCAKFPFSTIKYHCVSNGENYQTGDKVLALVKGEEIVLEIVSCEKYYADNCPIEPIDAALIIRKMKISI